jgi:phosphoribosylamine--glycine ligase
MRVLVIGSGAREHALVARLTRDLVPGSVICAPGNPGISALARTISIDSSDIDALLLLAERDGVDLTVVGPELPLSLGIVDRFLEAGRAIFGPTASAAKLESSKAFAKNFMARHGVPTARFHVADSLDDALRVLKGGSLGWPVVLKADGLAGGKGVVVSADLPSAETTAQAVMSQRKFGSAGDKLVLEEFLAGTEVSFFVVCDGVHALPIGTAQDHKRIFDDDRGPNTGGMGAFAPSPLVTPELQAQIMREIVTPVMAGMSADGHSFSGFLYAGLMLTDNGPRVIEFNVRLGDPEAQVILALIDEPLAPLLAAAAAGRLEQPDVRLGRGCFTGVVIASRGYPDSSETGREIRGMREAEAIPGLTVYHAGTARTDGHFVTAGGRVLTVVGRGTDYAESIVRAYAGVLQISFDGMQFRHDIGRKALAIRN